MKIYHYSKAESYEEAMREIQQQYGQFWHELKNVVCLKNMYGDRCFLVEYDIRVLTLDDMKGFSGYAFRFMDSPKSK